MNIKYTHWCCARHKPPLPWRFPLSRRKLNGTFLDPTYWIVDRCNFDKIHLHSPEIAEMLFWCPRCKETIGTQKDSQTANTVFTWFLNLTRTMYLFGVLSFMIFMLSILSLYAATYSSKSLDVMDAGTDTIQIISLRPVSSVREVFWLKRKWYASKFPAPTSTRWQRKGRGHSASRDCLISGYGSGWGWGLGLEATSRVRGACPGCHWVLGVSGVTYTSCWVFPWD